MANFIKDIKATLNRVKLSNTVVYLLSKFVIEDEARDRIQNPVLRGNQTGTHSHEQFINEN